MAVSALAAIAVIVVLGVSYLWVRDALEDSTRANKALTDEKTRTEEALHRETTALDQERHTSYASRLTSAHLAWLGNSVDQAVKSLEDCPVVLRGWEWRYLQRLCHSELLSFPGNNQVVFSPDGHTLAAPWGRNVIIWDLATGKPRCTCRGHSPRVASLAFRPDGRRLVSTGGQFEKTNEVKIWNTQTGKELFQLRGQSGPVYAVAYSPDGRRIATAGGNSRKQQARIWNADTGEVLQNLTGVPDYVRSIRFSPDGKQIVVLSNQTIHAWDAATGKTLFSTSSHYVEQFIRFFDALAFSPDGKLLAATVHMQLPGLSHRVILSQGNRMSEEPGYASVVLLNLATGKEQRTVSIHTPRIPDLAFHPDGKRIALGCADGTVRLVDVTRGDEVGIFRGHREEVLGVAFHPDGRRLASVSRDGSVKVWDTLGQQDTLAMQGRNIALSTDGRSLIVVENTLSLVDVSAAQPMRKLLGRFSFLNDLSISPGKRYFALTSMNLMPLKNFKTSSSLGLWDLATFRKIYTLWDQPKRISLLGFSPDDRQLFAATEDGEVYSWDTNTGAKTRVIQGMGPDVWLSPGGRLLAETIRAQDVYSIQLRNVATGTIVRRLPGELKSVAQVAFSRDGQRVAVATGKRNVANVIIDPEAEGRILVWDVNTGEQLLGLVGGRDRVVFSPDGSRLATGAREKDTVKIWNAHTGDLILVLRGTRDASIDRLAFSADGHRLAAILNGGLGTGSIRLWNATPLPPETLDRPKAFTLVFSLFGRLLLKADVLEQLRTESGLSAPQRQLALEFAQLHDEDPAQLNQESWKLVRHPAGDAATYRRALRFAEAACRMKPDDASYLNTLSVAQYRAGKYREAIEALTRSDQIHRKAPTGSIPEDLAFLAMAYHQLGQTEEARKYRQRLRDRLQRPDAAGKREWQDFRREVEASLNP